MERTEWARKYREADLACARLAYRLRGARMYERQILLPTREHRQDVERQLSAAREQVAALQTPEPVFALVKNHLIDFLDAETLRMNNFFTKPTASVEELSWKMEFYADIDSRDDEERADILLSRLRQTPELPEAARRVASDPQSGGALARELADIGENYRHYEENLAAYFPALGDAQAKELTRAILAAREKMSDTAARIRTGADQRAADDMDRRIPFTEDYYRGVLHDNLGVELDELLAWHEQEIERTRAEVKEICLKLPVADKPKTMIEVSAALTRYAGPCDTPEEMFARARSYIERAREAARGYVIFPEEILRVEKVPYPLRESFPWGGYADGDGRRPITGKAFLNDRNYRAISDGWIKIQALHEAYPGHHLQYVRSVTDTLPETVKLGAKHIPLIEGAAHRSERLFEFVFEEDPFYPLFVAFRRHHTAVRIKSDLMLRYFGRTIGDAVKLYRDELDFDENTARGQVRAQEQMEGYFTCYYYGMKRIADLEENCGADAKSFTETLFSCGNISMENLEQYLKLNNAQKTSYRTDFCSLLMDSRDVSR